MSLPCELLQLATGDSHQAFLSDLLDFFSAIYKSRCGSGGKLAGFRLQHVLQHV